MRYNIFNTKTRVNIQESRSNTQQILTASYDVITICLLSEQFLYELNVIKHY